VRQVIWLRSAALACATLLLPALLRADAPAGQYGAYLSTDDFIVDNFSGLEWQRAMPDKGAPPLLVRLADARCPDDSGATLPTVRELATLLDNQPTKILDKNVHADLNAFPRTPGELFWTMSQAPDGKVFVVDFGTGEIKTVSANGTMAYVRCVKRPP
jgi:hypothetical protein